MGIVLGPNQYGKAEIRLVAVDRSSPRHALRDLTVGTSLRGDFDGAHYDGDNAHVLPTDTQKNTAYAFAKQAPIGEIEDFALRLGRHFIDTQEPVRGARILVEEHAWARIPVDGEGHDHSFHRAGEEKRTAAVTLQGGEAHVVSGLSDLVVLKSTGSEFWGYPKDEYTTLPETTDRILATAVTARWRHLRTDVDFGKSFDSVRASLLEGVEHQLDRPITVGVDRESAARTVHPKRQLDELVFAECLDPVVTGAFEGLFHQAGSSGHRSIRERLDSADSQPVIPKTGA